MVKNLPASAGDAGDIGLISGLGRFLGVDCLVQCIYQINFQFITLYISNFLDEISCLSHSKVFLYFFALINEEGSLYYLSLLFFVFYFNFFIIIIFYFTVLYWFCRTSICICHGCTRVPHPEPHLPPPFPYHPSGSFQCTSPKLPVSCNEPGLAIHFLYDIIHVLMPFSQIIHPPSPTESIRLF